MLGEWRGGGRVALDRRFSYLLGAYERYGKQNTIHLANAEHKAELLRDILVQLGCEDVAWRTHGQGIPWVHVVEFEPTSKIRSWLSM